VTPDVTADRRIAQRFAMILTAEIVELPSGAKFNARSSDISRTGCYIDMLNPILSGSLVRLRLTRGDEVFHAAGKIVYVSPGLGMGLQFDDSIPSDQLAILDRWLEEAPSV
jgi:hypothetical protein